MILFDLLSHLIHIVVTALYTTLSTLVVANEATTLLMDTNSEIEVGDTTGGIRFHAYGTRIHRVLVSDSNSDGIALEIVRIKVEERLLLTLLHLTTVQIIAGSVKA